MFSYYGPTREAAKEVNRLLRLNATGSEQDWEIEFADPSAIDTMLDVLSRQQLEIDVRAALCLLMLASFEEAFDVGEVDSDQMLCATALLRQDRDVLGRMRYYWLELRRTHHPELTMRLLSV